MPSEKNILIVEDNADVIQLLKDILEPDDYQITAFTAVTDIVATMKQVKPDMVILDYILEGINGGEYCSQIKNHPDIKYTPVMILSAYPKVILSLGDYGADVILYKPFDIDEFKMHVLRMTDSDPA